MKSIDGYEFVEAAVNAKTDIKSHHEEPLWRVEEYKFVKTTVNKKGLKNWLGLYDNRGVWLSP